MEQITLIGYSGVPYLFTLLPLSVSLPETGGVYVYMYHDTHSRRYIYCGQSDSLEKESAMSDKNYCILASRPNCVAVLLEPTQKKRCSIERDIWTTVSIAFRAFTLWEKIAKRLRLNNPLTLP